MLSTYKEQISKILADTEEKAKKDKKNNVPLAAITMLKVMVGAISKYVEKESAENKAFNDALSLEHKSAQRMLKYVWKQAEGLAMPMAGVNGNACCLPDEIVYGWISEYYLLDDKAEYEKEMAEIARKKAEEEARKKEEAEKEALAREKAIAKLEKEEGWEALSEEEKEKKIKEEARKIKSHLGKKKTTKKTDSKKTPAKEKESKKSELDEALAMADGICEKMTDKAMHMADDKEVANEEPEETGKIVSFAPRSSEKEIEIGDVKQFTLFDLMNGGDEDADE